METLNAEISTQTAQTALVSSLVTEGFRCLVWSVEVSQTEGEVDTLSGFDADQLSLLLGLRHAGSDGVRPRRNLDEEIFI